MGRDPEKPNFYGRRKGHKLRAGRQDLFDTKLPALTVPLGHGPGSLDPAFLFDPPNGDVWLEIGFGSGEHLAHQAQSHPEIGFLGAEPFINGVATLLSVMERDGIDNILLLNDDVRLLLNKIAPGSLGRVFILHPDPWPKTRHHKRRLFSHETLDTLARLMKPGALLRFASDDMKYIRWALEIIGRRDDFAWQVEGPADWRNRPDDAVETRYEAKALKQGKRCVYLNFLRTDAPAAEPKNT